MPKGPPGGTIAGLGELRQCAWDTISPELQSKVVGGTLSLDDAVGRALAEAEKCAGLRRSVAVVTS